MNSRTTGIECSFSGRGTFASHWRPIPAFAGVLLLLLAGGQILAREPALSDVCREMSGFDQDGDGQVEIARLRPLFHAGRAGPLALLLVEGRLLETQPGAASIAPHLVRWTRDVAAERGRAAVVVVGLAPSALHQDGRYILALREFLRAVNAKEHLAGVMLVGHFPDAFLVRTCNWRKKGDVTLRKGKAGEKTWHSVRYLRRVPEAVADRADIVLADLDGRWEDVYVQPRTALPTTWGVYPEGIPPEGGPCVDMERGEVVFRDFFHVADGELEVKEVRGGGGEDAGWSLLLHDRRGNRECGEVDGGRPNAMAVPDLPVSRLDARGVALRPRRDLGVDFLDDAGRPQEVRFPSKRDVPHWRDRIWEHDPLLERRLLAQFFERNHAYRTGRAPVAFRPSSLANGLRSGYRVMARAADDWAEGDPVLADQHGRTTLMQVVSWLAYPAVLRTLRAHSDPWGAAFTRGDTSALERRIGGPCWSFTPRGDRLVPSLDAACRGGKLDWFLMRTLYENDLVAKEPTFYHYTGCHGISPPGARKLPYDHPAYGVRQGGESLLFFGNGLALIGRAKVFYDEPRGFAETLREGRAFGAAWARYFEIESAATSWKKVGGDIGRKRAYFWSVLGDWSLRLTSGR